VACSVTLIGHTGFMKSVNEYAMCKNPGCALLGCDAVVVLL
jgi:hypothetical protein